MTFATSTSPRYASAPTVPGYALHEFLGRGSSAVVWAATSDASGERVAVKVFAGDRPPALRGQVLAATWRELTLSQRLETGHVVRARAGIELDDGRIALVLDLADAGSLRDVVSIRGALPLGEVVTTATPLATALAELAASGVVHGDLAPGNVLFTTDGRPVLGDLSAAWLVDDGWPETLVGTTGFIAPEVLAGRPPTPASDIWALGALLWYARTGGGTPPGWVGDLHWGHGPVEASAGEGSAEDVTAAVGPELRPLLLRMLADDPHARPTAAEAALAIYRVAAPEAVVLVGRHPDPAAAVTNRIRREAAETRSRTQLRAVERAERRRAHGATRRARLGGGWFGRAARRTGGGSPRPAAVRGRVVAVTAAGLVLAAGMFGLMAVGGVAHETPIERVASSLAPGTAAPTDGALPPTPPSADGTAPPTSAALPVPPVGSDPALTPAVTTAAIAPAAVATPAAPPTEAAAGPAAALDAVRQDPTAVLQRLADVRAAALAAADPVALVGAEPEGTTAYAADVATIARLRDQRQHYRDLTFSVRAAAVVSTDATVAVVRATVDRSACTVEGDDGSTQSLAATSGQPLGYTLRLTDGSWRLTDVGSG